MTIKVLFIIDQLRRGGAERLLLDLLPRLPAYGIEPRLCVLGREAPMLPDFRAAGIEAIVLGSGKWDPRLAGRLAELVHRHDIDLLSAHLGKSVMLGWLTARRTGIPLVAHEHVGPAWPHFSGTALHRLENRLMWQATEWCLCRAAAVVAVSEPCRQWLIERHPDLAERTTTIANGIDLHGLGAARAQRQRHRQEVRREFGIPAESLLVMNAASFRPVKRWDVFAEVAERLCREDPTLHFIGAGTGPQHPELRSRIAASAVLRNRFHLPGSREDVPRLLAAADLFLMPSAMESDGIALKEAMAMGLPIVASDIPILRDKLKPGESGFLLPVGDVPGLVAACSRLLADPALREACGATAVSHADAHFGIAACAEQTQALFHRVAR